MNTRERILVLQAQVAALQLENAALKLTVAKSENVVLKKAVDDMTAAAIPVGSPVTVK